MADLLIPGEFYVVKGLSKDGLKGNPELIDPVLYVRDEKMNDHTHWNVFAGIWEHGLLMRVKVPFNQFSLDRNIVNASNFLETKILIFPKEERAESVQTFIDDAYRLIRESGPHVRTFENDAYEAAGIFGVHNILRGRLKTIIDHYKRREN